MSVSPFAELIEEAQQFPAIPSRPGGCVPKDAGAIGLARGPRLHGVVLIVAFGDPPAT